MIQNIPLSKGHKFAIVCSLLVLLIVLIVMAGWIFRIDPLLYIHPQWPTMKINTALGLMLCSVSLMIFSFHGYSVPFIVLQRILSFTAFLIGVLAITEHFLQKNLISNLLIKDHLSNTNIYAGRPSIIASINLIIIALTLFIKANPGNFKKGEDQYLLLLPLLISILPLFCYMYGSSSVLHTPYTSMAFHSALSFTLLLLGTIFTQSDRGWAQIAVSKTASGNLLRNIFIPNIILFPILGFLRLRGELHSLYDSSFGVTIMVAGEIFIIGVALIIQGKRLYKLENKLKITAERLEKSNLQLSRINKDLDNFVYTASHDLKAPIGNIEALTHMLFVDLPEEIRNRSSIISIREMLQTSIEKFKANITDLATIAKEQVLDQAVMRLPVQEVTEEVKTNLYELIEEAKPEFIEDYSQAPSVRLSRKNLRSILQNLISNAIKYRHPERKASIQIITDRDGEYFILRVRDNGLGIKEEDKARVFAMYNRLHEHIEGTGIGMTIVARIVDNNGGKITVDSEVGQGTTFNIYLKEE